MIPIMTTTLIDESQNSSSPKNRIPKPINGYYSNKEDGDEYSGIYLVPRFPVLNDQGGCGQLIGRDDDVFEEIRPTESKSESWIAESCGISRET